MNKHIKRAIYFVEKAFLMPKEVVLFRVKQATSLQLHKSFHLWQGIEAKSKRYWSVKRSKKFKEIHKDRDLLIDCEGIKRLQNFFKKNTQLNNRFLRKAQDERSGLLEIFGEEVEIEFDNIRWREDWRNGHVWELKYFKDYDHYNFDKDIAYDVKFPWELSRLDFLMLPTLFAVLNEDEVWWGELADILSDFIEDNPFGFSVNWNPMECSMRAINLAQLAMLHLASSSQSWNALSKLLYLCDLHGRFLWRTIEYTDIRGNHYAANLVALYLLSTILLDTHKEASMWRDYALEKLDNEILLQYTSDGIQIEKSIPYHRLVTQLFLLSMIARQKADDPIQEKAKNYIKKACYYTDSYIRPDHCAPCWGDNDDATALSFSIANLRDHRDLLNLATLFFDDFHSQHELKWIPESSLYFEKLDILESHIEKLDISSKEDLKEVVPMIRHFEQGGMIIAKNENYHFICDVGEIGLYGRGGHGHHDTLSFELSLRDEAIIVDRGSFIYTGDRDARNDYRRTASHNVLQIDAQEMGSMDETSLWILGNEARPHSVKMGIFEDVITIQAMHNGYKRLQDPVTYQRKFIIEPSGHLKIIDILFSQKQHHVKRFFHFNQGLSFVLKDRELIIQTKTGQISSLSWNKESQVQLKEDWISLNYGKKSSSFTLILEDHFQGEVSLEAEIIVIDGL